MTKEERHLENLLTHIHNVQKNCLIIARKINDALFARKLIANSMVHDNSKFYGIEWEYLRDDVDLDKIKMAAIHHAQTNPHHPQYHGHISRMSSVELAEMAADWAARSAEQGQCTYDWITNKAYEKFHYTKDSDTDLEIKRYLNLLFEKPFSG